MHVKKITRISLNEFKFSYSKEVGNKCFQYKEGILNCNEKKNSVIGMYV